MGIATGIRSTEDTTGFWIIYESALEMSRCLVEGVRWDHWDLDGAGMGLRLRHVPARHGVGG